MRHSRFLFPGEFEAKLRQFPYNEVYMVIGLLGQGAECGRMLLAI